MWTSLDAIETESAVEIAFLFGLKKFQFAAPFCVSATDTIQRLAAAAYVCRPDFHFERRDQRLYEMELPDWADIFAKGCATKKSVDQKRCDKISDDDPGR